MFLFSTLLYVLLLFVASANASSLECITESLTLGVSNTSFGVLLETFGFLMEDDLQASIASLCGRPSATAGGAISCDLDGTDLYTNSTLLCNSVGGQIIPQDLKVCGDDLATLEQSNEEFPDVEVKNIPVCMAESCDAGTNLFELLASFSSLLGEDGLDENLSVLLSNGDCSTTDPEDSSAGSAIAPMSTVFIGLVSLGITLFAMF